MEEFMLANSDNIDELVRLDIIINDENFDGDELIIEQRNRINDIINNDIIVHMRNTIPMTNDELDHLLQFARDYDDNLQLNPDDIDLEDNLVDMEIAKLLANTRLPRTFMVKNIQTNRVF
jgi:hypothetical protein